MKRSFFLSLFFGAAFAPLAAQAQLPLGGGGNGGLLGGVLGRSGPTGGTGVTGGGSSVTSGGGGVVGSAAKGLLGSGSLLGGLVNTTPSNNGTASSGLLGGLLTPVLSLTSALPNVGNLTGPLLGGGITNTILSPLGLGGSAPATGSSSTGLLGLGTGTGGLSVGGISVGFNQGWSNGYPFESNTSGLWYLYGSSPYKPFLPFTTSFSGEVRPPLTPTIQPLTIGGGLR